MNYITITTEKNETYSSISNFFIDYYMTSANGDFVKIYLYLLRLLSSKEPVSIADIARHFGLTENFVCKAIRYWISQDVMKLNYNSQKVLTGITLLPLRDRSDESDNFDSLSMLGMDFSADTGVSGSTAAHTVAAPTDRHLGDLTANQADVLTSDLTNEPVNDPTGDLTDTAVSSDTSDTPFTADVSVTPDKKTITNELLAKKNDDETFADIRFEAETYYNKPLSMPELEILIYIYDQLDFSPELIEYLMEYCITRGKYSFRYAEAVAREWYKKGIDTVDKAKEDSKAYNPLFRKVFKELGIPRTSPTNAESAFIDAWSDEFGFTEELITLACRKAILSKPQSANFSYVNAILEKWHKNGVKSIQDVEVLDQEHLKQMAEAQNRSYNSATKPNGFANFQQTDMSDQLSELEQLLADDLNRNKKTS